MMRYSVTLALVCLAGLLGACAHSTRKDSSAGMLASREVPKLEKIETRPSLGSTPKSAMKLSYDSGAALDLKFDSTKFDVVNVEDGSGITIFNGLVRVNAVLPKDTKTRITAPTFWRRGNGICSACDKSACGGGRADPCGEGAHDQRHESEDLRT